MASLTWWTWVWGHSRSWWWTGRPGALQFMELQRVGHDWVTELNLTCPCPPEQDSVSPQPIPPIKKLAQASYPHPLEGRQKITITRKLSKLITWTTAWLTQWDYEPCQVGPPKTDRSWWRVLTKHGLLVNGMANHFSILALRTPWTVWKGNV